MVLNDMLILFSKTLDAAEDCPVVGLRTAGGEKHPVTLAGRAAPGSAATALAALHGAGIEASAEDIGENSVRFIVRPGQELDALRLLHGMI